MKRVANSRCVIAERNGSNQPQVAYTRGTDLSGSLEGAGGIGGLLARSHDFQQCTNMLTYRLTNSTAFCLTNLNLWDASGTYVSGAAIAAGNIGTYSFAGVPGRLYSVWGDSCDPYQIQVFGDSFYGVLSTRATDFSWDDDAKEVVLTTTETGLPLCENGTAWHWATHNYYHADGNGNVTALVAANETLTASYRYDPFGNTTSSSGGLAGANVYRFSSKEVHSNSGMYYYGYRFYDANVQRWLTRDPIEERGGKNLYRFVGNEPISLVDPNGHGIWRGNDGEPIKVPTWEGPYSCANRIRKEVYSKYGWDEK